jgi:DNA-binding FadR family transcriptional regulator
MSSDSHSQQRRYLTVAQDLMSSIARGEYSPGDRLPSHGEVATAANVSRATAREALLALELVGSVEVRHGDGTFVRSLVTQIGGGRDAVLQGPPRDLIEARRSIEPMTAELAATRIDPDRVAQLSSYIDSAELLVDDASSVAEFVALGLRFHSELAPGCGNPLLADIVRQLVDVESHPLWALVNQRGMTTREARESQVREHRAILDAVASGDSAAAAAQMTHHLEDLDRAIFVPESSSR